MKCCRVLGCASQRKVDGVKLFPFPASMRDRRQWIQFCARGEDWQPPMSASICERHFVDGKPTAANPNPTLTYSHPKYASHENRQNSSEEGTDLEPLLLFGESRVYANRKRVQNVSEEASAANKDTSQKRKKVTDCLGVDTLLSKWHAANSSTTFSALKVKAEEFAIICKVRLNENFYAWLEEWRKHREIPLEGKNEKETVAILENGEREIPSLENARKDVIGGGDVGEESEVISAIRVVVDADDSETNCESASSQVKEARPTLDEVTNALGILRRYLGKFKEAKYDSLDQLENEVLRLSAIRL